ncbi:hypothetical protein L484_020113 [Morus notabilis]|uniref:Uncharacterized protein n=1 Tax=Morus notabilis TaxID=981085 RepID=W9RJI4_9ROSA|nr:hypothetical protein L484_020113 [Morus notabilis]
MTDIAILVTEEFERSAGHSRKDVGTNTEENQELGLVSCVSVLAQSLKKKIREEKMKSLKKLVKEPKTQIGLAAYNGFFSA